MHQDSVIKNALQTIQLQADSIQALAGLLNDEFSVIVEKIAHNKGRLVVSGIGKSAIIAQKMVATLNSTGTPALFLHAADAIHGDLGMVTPDDIVMIISKSGDSPEIKVLLPLVKGFGNPVIGMVGNLQSFLAKNADWIINTTVAQEACPNNLAPTTSTTAQMVMGDALAVCLMQLKNFKKDDFARFHPGGALGKKLYLRVTDILSKQKPSVSVHTPVKELILEITRNRLGAAAVVSQEGQIEGIVTDGDLRRMLEKHTDINQLTTGDIMSRAPKTVAAESLAAEAFDLMRQHNINQLLVTEHNRYAGIIHIQDLIREGII